MRKRVFVALRMAGVAGQEKLSGLFRFLGEKHDWDIRLVRTAAEFTPAAVRDAVRDGFDGFIVSIPDTEKTAAVLAETDIPTIVMDIHSPCLAARTERIVFIRNSAREIGRTAADCLLSIGACRSYAVFHNPSDYPWSIDRFKAFRETMRESGFWCHELKTLDGLRKLGRPVGVFAANDDRGYDVIEFCHAHRLRVPEDVLVLGVNNDTLICENCHPRLSSLQPDFEQEGFLAGQTLARMMGARRSSTSDLQPTNIFVGVKAVVRRESTTVQSPAGKLVQKALAYISRNALHGISVEDVARHLKVSRRLVDLRFRELQGVTIGETIIRLRLEEVKRLLRTTKEPIGAIAAQCGYPDQNYLKKLFRKRFFLTMRDFRKSNALPKSQCLFAEKNLA